MNFPQEEVRAKLEKGEKLLLLDVRTPEEFAEGHVPGAVNIPVSEEDEVFLARLPDRSRTIYVYCRSGFRAENARKRLLALGYRDVVNFGGVLTWKSPLVKD